MTFDFSFRLFSMLTAAALAWSIVSSAQALEWSDDFEDGDVFDDNPVTWTHNEIGLTLGTVDASTAAFPGDAALSNSGGGSDDNIIPSVEIALEDTYVRTQAFVAPGLGPDETGGKVGVMARWDPFTFNGYAFTLDDGAQYALSRVDGGSPAPLDSGEAIGIDATADVIIELEFVGDQINGYFYRPGDPRPETPITSVNDSTYASGRAGILYNEDDDNTAGVFRWAQAQDTPLPPLTVSFEADFDRDGDVDGDDFLRWQGGFGTTSGAEKMDGDYDNDEDVDGDDFLGWQAEFGSESGAGSAAVPEPASAGIVAVLALAGGFVLRRRRP